jgi:uncharacterized membrane protein
METLIIIISTITLLGGAWYLYYYVTHIESDLSKSKNVVTSNYSTLRNNQRINDKFSLVSLITGKHQDDNDYDSNNMSLLVIPLIIIAIAYFASPYSNRYGYNKREKHKHSKVKKDLKRKNYSRR